LATITRPNDYTAGGTISASAIDDDLDTIYTDYNGGITNVNIASAAAIAYSKTNLASAILNTDLAGSQIQNVKLKSYATISASIATSTPGTFAHGLGATPAVVIITPKNAYAGTAHPYGTADGTNIIVTNSVTTATAVIDIWAMR
jgi:hypothetical protein